MSVPTGKILIVDDEREIRSMLNIFLGFDFQIVEADSGASALRQAIVEEPDMVLLDLGLPDMDGTDVLLALRRFSQVPIVVLTARSADVEIVRALSSGADDYVTKPFRAEVLLARINANLRGRAPKVVEILVVENGPIRIDRIRHEVHLNGKYVALPPKTFSLLEFFIDNKGKILTHKEILKAVWGPDHAEDTQYLRVYVRELREKLETVPGLSKVIVAETRIGYRMVSLPTPPLAATAPEPHVALAAE